MAGAVVYGSRLYSGWTRLRLWRGVAAAGAGMLALACGGCSMSYQLDSFFGGERPDATASITPPPGAKSAAQLPPSSDLAYARAAASELLRRGKKDASQPWENPESGARGTVTPIAAAYVHGGRTCQNFLASYVNGRDEAWLEGEACEQTKGAWEVRTLKPWKRS